MGRFLDEPQVSNEEVLAAVAGMIKETPKTVAKGVKKQARKIPLDVQTVGRQLIPMLGPMGVGAGMAAQTTEGDRPHILGKAASGYGSLGLAEDIPLRPTAYALGGPMGGSIDPTNIQLPYVGKDFKSKQFDVPVPQIPGAQIIPDPETKQGAFVGATAETLGAVASPLTVMGFSKGAKGRGKVAKGKRVDKRLGVTEPEEKLVEQVPKLSKAAKQQVWDKELAPALERYGKTEVSYDRLNSIIKELPKDVQRAIMADPGVRKLTGNVVASDIKNAQKIKDLLRGDFKSTHFNRSKLDDLAKTDPRFATKKQLVEFGYDDINSLMKETVPELEVPMSHYSEVAKAHSAINKTATTQEGAERLTIIDAMKPTSKNAPMRIHLRTIKKYMGEKADEILDAIIKLDKDRITAERLAKIGSTLSYGAALTGLGSLGVRQITKSIKGGGSMESAPTSSGE